jgi:phenylpropionate dioxygenase-like ring-hydroxylating dioxygenase large terminal subunit
MSVLRPRGVRHRKRLARRGAFRAGALRCPYHGFTWWLDGTLAHVPAAGASRLRQPLASFQPEEAPLTIAKGPTGQR